MNALSFNILDGVAVVTLDLPGSKVNILNLEVLEELNVLLSDLEEMADALRGAIFISGKGNNFIAGADLSLIEGIDDAVRGAELAAKGQRVFDRLASLPVPTAAAINGSCLGGGLEFALACDYRVVSDSAGTFLGLPETQLGIIPGFGGTQRLPRLVGLAESLRMITTGSPVYAGQAKRIGLVNEVTATEHLLDAAMAAVEGRLSTGKRKRTLGRVVEENMERFRPGRKVIANRARRAVIEKTRSHYPAPLAAIAAVEYGLNHGMEKGLAYEARILGEMAVTEVSKRLIGVFHLRESFARGDKSPAAGIADLSVIGAGAMGGGIAALAAEHGLNVRLVDRSDGALGSAMRFLHHDVATKRRKGRYTDIDAQWIPTRISPDTGMRWIGSADVVIEAVAERMDVKKAVFAEAAAKVSDDTLILTNTSSLSVTRMAEDVPHPERVAGLHFFNPVDRMPLVEVIRGERTSDATVERTAAFARLLGKVPVVVRDRPGFLVNRLLLPYMNEAAVLLEEGADIESVDRALMDFGMPMGVYYLLDQVGLDIASHAGRSMFEGFGDRMTPSPIFQAMIEAGRLGKKAGKGFYLYDRAGNRQPDPTVKNILAPHIKGTRSFTPEEIVHRLIYPMINEAALVLEEDVVNTPEAVDAAMVLGAGFPPFTGGLLRYADSAGAVRVTETLGKLSEEAGHRFSPAGSLVQMAKEGKVFYP
ncbi:MAG: enoyl-CoA hydratase/isomerase family protein [bacterium]|nr:MAG: enoyl-CoA hydratase/isomerase family protein [bacterium]